MGTVTLRGPRVLLSRVVGVTFADGYPLTVQRIVDCMADGTGVHGQLVRDPANPHDPNAIRVICVAAGGHIGHVPRSVAARLAPCLDAGISYDVEILDVRHPNHPDNPGIEARLTRRDRT
jgi:hypothetical protein